MVFRRVTAGQYCTILVLAVPYAPIGTQQLGPPLLADSVGTCRSISNAGSQVRGR